MSSKRRTKPTAPTADADAEALESFQPVAIDVNNALDALVAVNADLKRHIDTESPGMDGERLREFHARYAAIEQALTDAIEPVNEVTEDESPPTGSVNPPESVDGE